MSKVKLTKEQKLAINLKNKNIIVSAQAGAGKTHILVERIVKLLEDERIDINEMLIVTFTNKAAAEMKDRIKNKLLEKINESSDKDKAYFLKQYNNTTNAYISTMHAFCISILRDYFYKLGINPGFKIIKDSTLDIFKWQAMNDIFEQYYKMEDKEFYSLVEKYSNRYSDAELMDNLFNIYNFIQSQIHPFEWLREKINIYKTKDYFNNDEKILELEKDIFDIYKDDIEFSLTIFKNNYSEIKKIYENSNCTAYQKNVEDDYLIFEKLKNISSMQELANFLENLTFSRANKGKNVKNSCDEADVKYIKALIDEYRKSLDFKDFKFDIEREIEILDEINTNLNIIYKILINFDKKFSVEKEKNNSLDFNDIEHLMIKLLDDDEVRTALKEKFKYIFFDEYQDANQVQDYIINKISSNNNLFFVGDIKQSIYKFRLADPLIFKGRYDNYKLEEKNNIAIDLNYNFRSHNNLLFFNNLIFNNLMTEELGNVNYNDYAHRLQAGKKLEEYKEDSIVSINYIFNDKEKVNSEDYSYEVKNKNEEAYFIAKKINELVKNGKDFKDIVVLSRTSQILQEIGEFLEKFNIPYYSESSKFSYSDLELKVFIEILKAVNNDSEDLTLITALKSSVANFTDEDLAIIRGEDKEHSFNYCFRNFIDFLPIEDYEKYKNLIEKIKLYNSKISEYRKLQFTMSLNNLLWYILVDSGYMSYILSKDNGVKILDNIKVFISEIKEYETNTFQALSSFLTYIDRILKRQKGDRESSAELSEEDNIVRLMTIHKSKGLQFDTVFLVDLSKNINLKDVNNKVILNDNLGLSLKVLNKNLDEFESSYYEKKIINAKISESYSEEIRILYVALTRAINNIYIISDYDLNNFEKANPLKMKNFNEWINSVLIKDNFLEELIKNLAENEKLKIKNQNINYNFFKTNKSELLQEMDKILFNSKEFEINMVNTEISKRISQIFNFKYDDTKVNMPYKKTVTEISEKDNNISSEYKEYEKILKETKSNYIIKKPKFINKEFSNKYSSLEKGTLYHYIFEKLPFDIENTEELDKFFDNLLDKNFVDQNEISQIDKNLIIEYINSDLYRRIKKSSNIQKESTFSMIYNENETEIIVDGQIDLYFEEDGELVIVDYKTNKNIDTKIYETQLNLYKRGLEEATGRKVKEKLIYWIMHGTTTKIE